MNIAAVRSASLLIATGGTLSAALSLAKMTMPRINTWAHDIQSKVSWGALEDCAYCLDAPDAIPIGSLALPLATTRGLV